jgi:hypothetical protein
MGDNHPSARAARIRKSLKDQPPVSRETSGETTTEDAGIDKENIESQPPANDARYSLRQRLNEYEKRTESNVTKFVRRGKKELTKEDAQGWANEAVRLVNDWYKNPIPEEAWELDEKGMPTKMVSLPEEAAPAYAELFITNEKVTKEQIQQWAKNRTFKKGSTLEIGRQLAKAAAKNDMQAVADIIQNLPIQEKKSQIKDFNAEFLRALAIKADAPSEVIRSKPETIEYLLRYKAGSQLPLFSLKEGEAGPWVTASNGEGDLYITRHGARAGTPHKTRQSSNDLVLRIDEAQLNKDYTYYLLQYLQKKIASRARGTAQQAIRAGDVDSVLTEYFASQSPRYSIKELARRVKASERMVEYNKERAEKNGHLVKTLMRTDWSAVEAAVDAATAGAVSANEVQDAIIEWMM